VTTLSTHVLDTARGLPAAGIVVTLDGAHTATTDTDGRAQLGELPDGPHELTFAAGPYLGDAAFYDDITVAFRVRGEAHLHVPLLLSPFGYSTYRGS
jgi:5-hydroxyisourate hydrolase